MHKHMASLSVAFLVVIAVLENGGDPASSSFCRRIRHLEIKEIRRFRLADGAIP